jgi:protein TonB
MNLVNHRLFYVSGGFSFLFFFLLVLLIFWKNSVNIKPITFAATKSDVISISLFDTPSVAKPLESVEMENSVETADPISEKREEVKIKAEKKETEPEITDLFSNVKPAKTSKKIKDNSEELSQLNAIEHQVLSSKRDSKLLEKVKNIDLAKTGVNVVANGGSTGPEIDAYKAKIQGIIYANFHPPSGTEGFTARVRIVLSPDGKLASFRIISYSGSSVFNAEVDWLKERLARVSLPSHPSGDESLFEIILRAKD